MTNEGPGATGDTVVDAATWKALPDGNAMPALRQGWASISADGVVGRRTWTAVPLALEFVVGLQYVVGD
ncbi:hypothetical protein AB0C12_29420 [Actinoplanes sp. NPDC048967]|uniref:hypothetical protein n=1 Tax=Actinoplanes sp. NPDC048967 TaxID=3155269 RepID=UPI0033F67A3F